MRFMVVTCVCLHLFVLFKSFLVNLFATMLVFVCTECLHGSSRSREFDTNLRLTIIISHVYWAFVVLLLWNVHLFLTIFSNIFVLVLNNSFGQQPWNKRAKTLKLMEYSVGETSHRLSEKNVCHSGNQYGHYSNTQKQNRWTVQPVRPLLSLYTKYFKTTYQGDTCRSMTIAPLFIILNFRTNTCINQ